MKTQVAIIGGGPSGTLLALLLSKAGIDVVILEKQTKEYVLSRIRAGVLEWNSVEMIREVEIGSRMNKLGTVHEGTFLSSSNKQFRVDFKKSVNKQVMIYGQTEVTSDLYNSLNDQNINVLHKVKDVHLEDLNTQKPKVNFRNSSDIAKSIEVDFVIGCDGYHGISRKHIPLNILKEYEKVYPFGWLGVLSDTPPVSHELIYANHERGFALASMRNKMLSRYYIQVPNTSKVEEWSDKNFWEELKKRLPTEAADTIVTGPSIEKSIAPLRSYVVEPMSWGKLFLVGDAAHIVPPTGAKGLNLAFSDVNYLSKALIAHYNDNNPEELNHYSDVALSRVWKVVRFSWWMTKLLHNFPNQNEFERKIQLSELDYLSKSQAAQYAFAENYVGLPY
tara:strand:- start:1777 stop:2949 length:1173 start_codon:yes stop_codon:yes gene_type:complete